MYAVTTREALDAVDWQSQTIILYGRRHPDPSSVPVEREWEVIEAELLTGWPLGVAMTAAEQRLVSSSASSD